MDLVILLGLVIAFVLIALDVWREYHKFRCYDVDAATLTLWWNRKEKRP